MGSKVERTNAEEQERRDQQNRDRVQQPPRYVVQHRVHLGRDKRTGTRSASDPVPPFAQDG